MASAPRVSPLLRALFTTALLLAGIMVLLSMYYKSIPSPKCHPFPKQVNFHSSSSAATEPRYPLIKRQTSKPVVLLWFWPESKKFNLDDCKKILHIDHCHLTDDRSLYSTAEAVVISHSDIKDDLSNLPTSPRPKFQRWIWLNMNTPPNTRKIAGIESLFNLTLSYRKDADIHVRWQLTVKKNTDQEFVPPKKKRLLCWIVEGSDLNTKSGEKYSYYRELTKHINVDVFNSSSADLKGENYFRTISSCKFFLSFEESIHRDYITEAFSGPLAVGTVPIALGPPRKNYEKFVPGTSFIHVNDFPNALELAGFLLKLDEDIEAYRKYFTWQQYYDIRRHFTDENHQFALAICQACHYVSSTNEYRVVRDLYKWLFL